MRRIMVNTLSPDCAVIASFSSDRATRRTRSWSMPSALMSEDRFASAVSYCATIRRTRSRSAARIDRPAGDAEVDHGLARGAVEAAVRGGQAGVLERVRQRVEWLAVVDPAEELPDG